MSDEVRPCEYCERTDDLWYCTTCRDTCCTACWDKRRAHRENTGPTLHERVRPAVKEQLTKCMKQPPSTRAQLEQHCDDEETTWFAFGRDEYERPFLEDYQRYASLMMDSENLSGDRRFPALVSFIGQTGAGKSSLIRLLVDKMASSSNGAPAPPGPVIGRSDNGVPTSSDVHMYLDPATASSDRPILYADCEGFDGGELDPFGRNAAEKLVRAAFDKISDKGSDLKRRVKAVTSGKKYPLQWEGLESQDRSKRGFAIRHMYPRIFYAFSDVVVLVLSEANMMEVAVEELLKWAVANYSNTINIPSKPYAIIALNKSDEKTPHEQWSVAEATRIMIERTDTSLEQNATFRNYIKDWSKEDKDNDGFYHMRSLLKRYYTDVKVIRLPDLTRFGRMDEQRGLLYDEISDACQMSRKTKERRQMLADADELGLYMSMAFTHFTGSEGLKKPFDFIEASLKLEPQPQGFKDNLKELFRIWGRSYNLRTDMQTMFKDLETLIASCLMLESSRRNRHGRPEHWFNADFSESDSPEERRSPKSYSAMCYAAIDEYLEMHAPCEALLPMNPIRVPGIQRADRECVMKRRNHPQHAYIFYPRLGDFWQLQGSGGFQNSFDTEHEKKKWVKSVLTKISDLHRNNIVGNEGIPKQAYAKKHQDTIRSLYHDPHLETALRSSTICLCCLFNPPEHELRCGHFLCTECVIDYGHHAGSRTVLISECPLHVNANDFATEKTPDISVQIDPRFSGLRVLVLDGGGVRGIIELCLVEALQKRLGVRLQQFFDLVVGTSTGGIIALAFGDQMWSVDECIAQFQTLVCDAFTRRKGQDIPYMNRLQQVMKSKYQTKPFEGALQQSFSANEKLFGARSSEGTGWQRRLDVAVCATSTSSREVYVLSNYNTKDKPPPHIPQYIRRTDMKVWEAARSTSAAPGFFRPFPKKQSSGSLGQDVNHPNDDRDERLYPQLIDGALRHNNPVEVALEEATRLSATRSLNARPDIVLSLGTGMDRSEGHLHRSPIDVMTRSDDRPLGFRTRVPGVNKVATLFTLIQVQVKLNLETDERWNRQREVRRDLQDRMFRINPDLGMEPPPIDEVGKVEVLKNIVQGLAEGDTGIRRQLDEIARRLVASSFYFERQGAPRRGSHGFCVLQGSIQCRFQPSSSDIVKLGEFLRRGGDGLAVFVIHNYASETEDVELRVPVDQMIASGEYAAPEISIELPRDQTETAITLKLPDGVRHLISGFPRCLMNKDFKLR